MEDVTQAAEDLERELRAELDAGADLPLAGGALGEEATIGTGKEEGPAESMRPGEETGDAASARLVKEAGLPPKPPAAMVGPTPAEVRQVARDRTFKKGLAGLPKRPAF